MMEMGEDHLSGKTHMKSDGTSVEKRAQKIFEEGESIVVFQHLSNTYGDENEIQGSNSETSISSLMRYEVFYTVHV